MQMRTIALWQMIAGASLIVMNVIAFLQAPALVSNLTYIITSVGVAALAIAAGLLLWRGLAQGIWLSLASQLLQVAWVSLPTMVFGSTLGPTAGLRITATKVGFSLGFYVRGGLALAPLGPLDRFPTDITVNVVAFFALVALIRELRARRQRNVPTSVASGLTSA